MERINFLIRFVCNYAGIVKEITYILRKDREVKRSVEARDTFARIKKSFGEAPVLDSPDYQKPFIIFSFSSPKAVVIVLLQKKEEEKEHTVAFFSQVLRDAELKYDIFEKWAYALVKALKYFMTYVMNFKFISYVPTIVVKDVITQRDNEGKGASG